MYQNYSACVVAASMCCMYTSVTAAAITATQLHAPDSCFGSVILCYIATCVQQAAAATHHQRIA
jgi:hypothetical protein